MTTEPVYIAMMGDMLGLDGRAARAAWTVGLMGLGAWLLWTLRGVLGLLAAAALFAYAVAPVVSWLARLSPRRVSRTVALAAVYVLLLAALGGGLTALFSAAVDEGAALAAQAPAWIERARQPWDLPLPGLLSPYRAQINQAARNFAVEHSAELLAFAKRLGGEALAALGSLPLLLLTPLFSFFLLKDAAALRAAFLAQWRGPGRETAAALIGDAHAILSDFMRAMTTLALVTLAAYGTAFGLLGVPYAVLLATVAALLEYIPVIGPLTGVGLALAVALFSGYSHWLWIVVFCAAYRLALDYVLLPYVMRSGLELPPLAILAGVLAGQAVGGAWGALLAMPALAVGRAAWRRLRAAPPVCDTRPRQ